MEDVPPSDLISFMHAQGELSLRKTFSKDQVVAIRPGYFATNLVGQHKQGITERKVKLVNPDSLADMITNEDMGEVAGTVLVEGQRDGQDFIYLFGPEMIQERDAYEAVGKLLGDKIEVVKVDADEGLQELVREGLPEPIAKYLVGLMQETVDGKDVWKSLRELHGEGVEVHRACSLELRGVGRPQQADVCLGAMRYLSFLEN
jgi:hypothetical protein